MKTIVPAVLLLFAAACDDAPDPGVEDRRASRLACEDRGGFAVFEMKGTLEKQRACFQKMKVATP